jgi:hypothetical protein
MAMWLSKLQSNAIDSAHEGRGVLRMLCDLMAVCRKASSAAHHYQDLKSLSDQALAEKGLERKDLARVAFDRLSQED